MKKRSMFVGMMILVLVLGVVGCSNEKTTADLAEIRDRGYVIVGLDDTFAPMGFRDEENNIVGFDVDLAKEVFARAGIEVRFQPIEWAMKETELNSENIDMIWNGYTITPERAEKVAFSTPYLENRQIAIVLAEGEIEDFSDFKGKTLAVQASSSAYDAVEKFPEVLANIAGGTPVLFDTNNEAFIDLEAGRTDIIVVDEIMARYYITLRGADKYRVLEENFGGEAYGIGFRKGSEELLALVETTLEEMKADGSAATISKTWFNEDIVK